MKDLPITNIEKFSHCVWDNGSFKFYFEKEAITTYIIEDFVLLKGNTKKCGDLVKHIRYCSPPNRGVEGIEIVWEGNPFDLDWIKDNFMIISDVEIKDDEE